MQRRLEPLVVEREVQAIDIAIEQWRAAGRSAKDIARDPATLPGERWTSSERLRRFVESR